MAPGQFTIAVFNAGSFGNLYLCGQGDGGEIPGLFNDQACLLSPPNRTLTADTLKPICDGLTPWIDSLAKRPKEERKAHTLERKLKKAKTRLEKGETGPARELLRGALDLTFDVDGTKELRDILIPYIEVLGP